MTHSLGFSVSCYRGDLPLLRGCLASIRYFAPDAPICLFTDGDFNVDRIVRAFDVTCIPRSSVRNQALRERSYGYGLTKMVALWEAPFERIIHVDADAVLWGDIRENLPDDDWDFVYNEPHELITDDILRGQYFSPELIAPLLQGFDWRRKPYFNSGVFACRVGALPLDGYLHSLDILESNYNSFPCMDQGILALMVFKAKDAGLLRVSQSHLQTVVPVVPIGHLQASFRFHQNQPILSRRPTVIHWAGPKPYLRSAHPFSEPMTWFRAQGMRLCGLPNWFPSRRAMLFDELRCRSLPRLKAQFKALLEDLIVRRRQQFG